MVEKLTTSELTFALDVYLDEAETLDNLKKQVNSAIAKVQNDELRISLGIDVSQDEYKADVDALLESINEYIEQKEVTMAMSINILFGDGSQTGDRLTSSVTSILSGYQEELRTKGEELKALISEGFENGEWIPDKLNEAKKLQEEIQEIYSYLADVDFRASVAAFDAEWSAVDLTSENFAEISEAAQAEIDKQVEALEGVRSEALKAAVLEYDANIELLGKAEAERIYNDTVAKIQDEFNRKKFDIYAEFGKFTIGGLVDDSYSSEVSELESRIAQAMEGIVSHDGGYAKVLALGAMGRARDSMTKEERKNIESIVESLKPTIEEYDKIIESYNALGQRIPEEIAKGIMDVKQLEALAGSEEAIMYLVGASFAQDGSSLANMLEAKNFGARLPESVAQGIRSNLTVVEDATKGTITLISDTFGEMTITATEGVKKNLEDMGIIISNGLGEIGKDVIEQTDDIVESTNFFDKLRGKLEEGWSSLDEWWKKLQLNVNMKFGVGQTSVAAYASGGFPSTGQMFIAREAGPELVGRIGNKTAVANNEQITSGIASAVYNAMIAAQDDGNSGNGGNARIVVQIGDRAVGEAAVKFINGQIVQTGTNPIYA